MPVTYDKISTRDAFGIALVEKAREYPKLFAIGADTTKSMGFKPMMEEFPEDLEQGVAELPITVVTPAFATSELRKGFQIGLYLYIPFLLIDIIVSSTLMSMGMIMLPPAMISTPFKLLLFITLNGWELLFSTLIHSFH